MARNNQIQIRRGDDDELPSSGLATGEPLFSVDYMKLYVASNGTTTNWVGAPIKDEDNMASAAGASGARSLATQQSIKAYVDAQLDAQDAVSELSDTTISSPSGGHLLLWDNSDSWDNKAMSGDATINSNGALTIAADAVEGTMLNDNVAGHGVEISSNALRVKLNGASLDRGASGMAVATNGIVNAMITDGTIANAKLDNSTITVSADSGSADAVSLGETLAIVGTSGEVNTAVSGNQIQIGLPDDVTIAGNLTVQGDTVTTNVATVTVEDPLVQYASNNSGNAVDIGFYGKYVASGTKYCGLAWDGSAGEFLLFDSMTDAPTTTVHGGGGTAIANSTLRVGTVNAATVDGGSYT